MSSSVQKLNNIISTIALAEKENKSVFINQQGDVAIRGKIGQLLFNIKALVKGDAWKNEQIQLNNEAVIDSFTKAINQQLTVDNPLTENIRDLYSKQVIRRYLRLGGIDEGVSKSPLGSIGAARKTGKLPQAQVFIDALNHITKNRNNINAEFKTINSIWIEAHRKGLPIHEAEFLILRNGQSSPEAKLEAKQAILSSLESLDFELASLHEANQGLRAGFSGARHAQNETLTSGLIDGIDKNADRLIQVDTIARILRSKLADLT